MLHVGLWDLAQSQNAVVNCLTLVMVAVSVIAAAIRSVADVLLVTWCPHLWAPFPYHCYSVVSERYYWVTYQFSCPAFCRVSCVLITNQYTLRNPDAGTCLRNGEVLYR